ncbi:MAG TPA: hypothetical protein VHA78_04690 [Candidatus Peribacteraceae bacterium]|nr:hypothetical protein [Candidatus Peribacteraceae bacterium]
MKRNVILIGALLLLPLQTAFAQSASSASSAPATLYDRVKDEVDNELTDNQIEPEVSAYVRALFKQTENLDLTDDDIRNALKGTMPAACSNIVKCLDVVKNIQRVVGDEERVRELGRDLQLNATSNELPVSNLPGRSLQLSRDMQGLVSIWSADNFASSSSSTSQSSSSTSASSASSLSPLPIRTKDVDPQVMQPLLQQLGQALDDLSNEERIAAVWHYQYGYRLVRGDRYPDYPAPYVDSASTDGTERQYLFKTQADVEAALAKIWAAILGDTFNPPLQPNETVLYIFPDDLMKDTLPDNVIVWARMDTKGKNDNHPLGDVGLQWKTPLEPVQPSLLSDEDDLPILGGNYPPEPVIPPQSTGQKPQPLDGRGLCTDPTQQRGYLCRAYVIANATDTCPDVTSASKPVDPTAITLVTCRKPSSYPTTIAGPDVCRDIAYQPPQSFDPNTQAKLNIHCEDTCSSNDEAGVTKPKTANGTIDICIKNNPVDIPPDYALFHELHHAYQLSDQKPGFNPEKTGDPNRDNVGCCEVEGEAYRAQADMMERDGIFKNMTPIDGIPVNAQTYAEAYTNFSCGPRDGFQGCYTSYHYTPNFMDALENMNANSIHGQTCNQIFKNVGGQPQAKDQRVQDLIDVLLQRKDVCDPGTVDQYSNRIGNNMCFIGQCLEQTLELHRVTGAQSPATVGDESFPWNDPLTGVALGNQLVNPPLNASPLPVYRPELVMNQLDTALCQLDGLPPKTPPILCAIQSQQVFQYPLTDATSMLMQLAQNVQDEQDANANLLTLAPAFGARIGTDLYTTYLQTASRSLSDVISQAVKLFKDMTSVSFPTQMCPTDQSLPPPVSSQGSSSIPSGS